jgi:outer membrane receptor protein involved in Fe transport
LKTYDLKYEIKNKDSTYFNIGGFYRNGEGGAQKTGFNSQDGGQLKASITKEFDKGNYVRLNFKSLSDKTPSLMPVPTSIDKGGNISPMRGIDPRTAYFINSSISRDVTIDRNGNPIASNPADGLRVQSTAIGAEARFDLGDGWILTDKFRKAQNSGRFMALFPADNGITGNPNAFTATMFNTSLDNMDNMFNDMKVSKTFDAGGGKAVVTGGLFTGTQNVAQTWFWNQYSVGMSNTGGTIGAPITNGWNTWGGCCARTYDVRYNVNDPYAAVNWDSGPLSIDASVRQQNQSATGSYTSGMATNAGTALSGGAWDPKSTQQVNYKLSKTSYSFGGNYLLDKDTSVYARMSDGYNFSADRLLYGTALNGSAPISYNQLRQQELGVKARRGNFSFFGTFFLAQTNESNYEATTQKFTSNKYDAKGLELEMGYRMGGFRLNGGATITRARITASNTAAEVGKTPRRQADVVYAISPSYRMGDAEIGAAFVGTSKAYGDNTNTINMAGYMITNAFASYQFTKSLVGSMSVNNLFNTLGYTEVEGDGHAARAVPGRTVRASLRYNF